jgi:hypothetical protein
VESEHVPSHVDKESGPKVFVEEVDRKGHGQKKTNERNDDGIVLVLEPQDWVGCQVAHVNALAELEHFWVLLAHQPTDVSEEKTARDVVRIGVCVAVLVVNAMISNPLDDRVLKCNRLKDKQNGLQFLVGFV